MDDLRWIIGLTKNKYAWMDEDVWCDVGRWNWYAFKSRNTWYAATRCNRKKTLLLHRFIMKIDDPQIHIDHINGDGLDCRRKNLRKATASQNLANSKLYSTNTSGFRGIHRNRNGSWTATAKISFGCFSTPDEAARAYDKFAKERYGQFARLNFPKGE